MLRFDGMPKRKAAQAPPALPPDAQVTTVTWMYLFIFIMIIILAVIAFYLLTHFV
jgi:hypothetical protein